MSARFNRAGAAVLAGVSAIAMVSSTPAFAQDEDILVRGAPEGTKVEVVSYRDLDLRYIAHLDKLNDRVGRAVRNVCDYRPRDLMPASYRECADAAWAGARPQIHRAYLRANRLAYSGL